MASSSMNEIKKKRAPIFVTTYVESPEYEKELGVSNRCIVGYLFEKYFHFSFLYSKNESIYICVHVNCLKPKARNTVIVSFTKIIYKELNS
jgi:hypothetical protein